MVRVQREIGRSNFGAMFVNRQGVGRLARRPTTTTAPTASTSRGRRRPTASCSPSSRAPIRPRARADPTTRAAPTTSTRTPVWNGGLGYAQVGESFNPEVGFLPRRAYRQHRGPLLPLLPAEAVAVDPPLLAARQLHRLTGPPQQARELTRALAFFEIQLAAPASATSSRRSRTGRRTVHGLPGRHRPAGR